MPDDLVEKEILKRILIDNREMSLADECSIECEHFEDDRNAYIFTAMKGLARQGKQIDLMTLVQYIDEVDSLEICGGVDYICSLV